MKRPTGVISKNKAIEIAGQWHDGQWSALYSFASSGIYDDKRYNDYIREVDSDLEFESNYLLRKDLQRLKRWFNYKHYEASEGLGGMRLELLGAIRNKCGANLGRELSVLRVDDSVNTFRTVTPYTYPTLTTKPVISPYTAPVLQPVDTVAPKLVVSDPVISEPKPLPTMEPLTTVTPLSTPIIPTTAEIKPVLLPALEPVKPVTFIQKATDLFNKATQVVTQVKQNLAPQTTAPAATDNKKEAGMSMTTGVMIASLGGAAILTGLMIARSKKRKRSGMGRLKKSRKRKRSRR